MSMALLLIREDSVHLIIIIILFFWFYFFWSFGVRADEQAGRSGAGSNPAEATDKYVRFSFHINL